MEIIEYEERVLIKEADYKKVINDIKNEGRCFRAFHIENIYLDNKEEFIYKNRMMLRIRIIDNKEQELTLKIKNPDGSNREINETLNKHPIIDKELDNRFNEYQEIAKLVTERIEVPYDDYLLVIDKNMYHGVIDYDIEIEAKSQQKALELIKKYCKSYNLAYDPKYPTKSHRAISLAKKKDEVD